MHLYIVTGTLMVFISVGDRSYQVQMFQDKNSLRMAWHCI